MTTTAAVTPYKGLAPFDDSDLDALLFFGRESESEIVAMNLLASRLTVLYGPSGVGKSSLLRAGVARKLRELAPDADVVVFSAWRDDPVSLLREEVSPGAPADVTLADAIALRDTELYLVLDQFEEYFLYHGDARGPETLVEQLPELVNRTDLRVNVLLGIREDALAKLDVFKARLPRLFGNYLRLDHLDRDSARAAILGPLGRYEELTGTRWTAEPLLVAAVLDEVAAGKIDAGRQGRGVARTRGRRRRVEAPYLQLVLQRLWEVESARGSTTVRLATLQELGGSERIVESHLERAMNALTPEQRDAAATMFDHLVTPSGTKIAHRLTDLATYAHVGAGELAPILSSLSRERIVRPLENGHNGDGGYEIYHDVLAAAVLEWRQRHEAERQIVEERVRERERSRRVFAALALVLVALAAMTLVAVYALSQRADAREQAAFALDQQRQAERNAKLALANEREAERNAAAARRNAQRAQRNLLAARRATAKARAKELEARDLLGQLRSSNAALADETGRANAAVAELEDALAETDAALDAAEASERAAQRNLIAARREERRANEAADRYRGAQLIALSRALLMTDGAKSLRAAVDATRFATGPEVLEVLQNALVSLRIRALLPGGGGGITAADFTPDSAHVAVASERGGVRLFGSRGAQLIRTFDRTGVVQALDFSPDGTLLATGARDGTTQLRDTRTGAIVRPLAHGGAVSSVEFTRDGRLLLTVSADRTVRVWDVATGIQYRSWAHPQAVRGAAISPDGAFVVTHTAERIARVFDVAGGGVAATLEHAGEVVLARYSPTGDTVVTAGRTNLYVWNVGSWSRRPLIGHSSTIRSAEYSPDGQAVVTTSIDGIGRIWRLDTGALENTLSGHRNTVVSAAFSPNGALIVTGSTDRSARMWVRARVNAQAIVLAGHEQTVRTVAFSPDGRTILTTGADTAARLWDPAFDPVLDMIGTHAPAAVTTARPSADGRLVLSAAADGTARVWGIRGGAVRTFAHGGTTVRAQFARASSLVLTYGDDGFARLWTTATGARLVAFAHGAPLTAAAASEDGTLVVTAGADGVAKVWTAGGRLLHTLPHGGRLAAAAFSPDGRVLATAGSDAIARLWNPRTGMRLRALPGHTDAIAALAFSPDGRRLATASADQTVRVWPVAGGQPLTLTGHNGLLTAVVFSRDGKRLLSTSRGEDVNVVLWDPATGRKIRDFSGHVSTVAEANFSRDGRWIVTAGPSAAGLWRTSDGSMLFFLRGEAVPLRAASFTNDGRYIVTGSADGSVRTYRCVVCGPLAELVREARRRLALLEDREAAARGR